MSAPPGGNQRVRWRHALVCALATFVLVANPAFAAAPLGWTAPYAADSGTTLYGVSCPSIALCAAFDRTSGRDIAASPSPAGTATWTPTSLGGGYALSGLSCTDAPLCFAIDGGGNVYTSTDPGAASPTWSHFLLSASYPLNGVSCVTGLCLVVDNGGNVYSSTTPTNPSSWQETLAGFTQASQLFGVSCASSSFCVATDGQGDVIASTDPAVQNSTWTKTNLESAAALGLNIMIPSCAPSAVCFATDGAGGNFWSSTTPSTTTPVWTKSTGTTIGSLTCPSATLCVGTGSTGAVVTSTNPTAGAPTWTSTTIDQGNSLSALSCASPAFCLALDTSGNAIPGYAPPALSSPPGIAGTAQQGQTLTEQHGVWTNFPTSYAYQWLRCDTSGSTCPTPIGSGQTYVLTAADVGHRIEVQETASNQGGLSDPASSAPTAVVTPSPDSSGGGTGGPGAAGGTPGAAGGTSGGGSGGTTGGTGGTSAACPSVAQLKSLLLKRIVPTGKPPRVREVLKRRAYRLRFAAPVSGEVVIAWYAPAKRRHGKPTLVATGRGTFSKAGAATITLRLTPAGRRMLKHQRRLKLLGQERFSARCGMRATATRTFTLG